MRSPSSIQNGDVDNNRSNFNRELQRYCQTLALGLQRGFTQDAYVGNGATDKWDSVAEKDFNFRTVDPADVKEVLLTTTKGTCWVDGNP